MKGTSLGLRPSTWLELVRSFGYMVRLFGPVVCRISQVGDGKLTTIKKDFRKGKSSASGCLDWRELCPAVVLPRRAIMNCRRSC